MANNPGNPTDRTPGPDAPGPDTPVATTPVATTLKAGTSWHDAWQRCLAVAPEAFRDDRVLNLWNGTWQADGRALPASTPVDGSPIAGPPRLDAATAHQAVRASLDQHRAWRHIPLDERRARVGATLDALTQHRELLALLLVWEIGKPWRLAQADVDRAIDGVRWYVDGIEPMVEGRAPLDGPVSNIASWNYPMSVLVHAVLIQALAGNAVIAKAPTDGGVACLTLACALAAREGIPVTLVSGSGGELSEALVRAPEIGCVSFIGGRDTGAAVATAVADLGKRHILEQEGLNTWGIWNYSDWDKLAAVIPKLFDYGKQRCTAYPRFVVQRSLFDDFLAAYLPAVRTLRVGHPWQWRTPRPLPPARLRPTRQRGQGQGAVGPGRRGHRPRRRAAAPRRPGPRPLPARPGHERVRPPGHAPEPTPSSPLHHAEPFGPVDTIVLVDTEAELLAAMNASNGALVAALSTDDDATYDRLAPQIRAFKTGRGKPRSRGDRDELFGGFGASWRGAFVGGELLVRAVTRGPEGERLPGNFPDYHLMP